jgi:hypothetical protein
MLGTTWCVNRNVAAEIEVNEALPVGEAQLVDTGRGIGDDRAAANGVDEDIDSAEFLFRRGHRLFHLRRVGRIAEPAVGPAAAVAQCRHRGLEPPRVIVDADDDRTLARHDLGGSPPDAVGTGGDQRDFVREPHGSPLPSRPLPMHSDSNRAARERSRCNSGFICRTPASRRGRS